jgi:hypothetical protein
MDIYCASICTSYYQQPFRLEVGGLKEKKCDSVVAMLPTFETIDTFSFTNKT